MTGVSLPFRTCLFTLLEVEYKRYPAGSRTEKLLVQDYTLIGIMQGTGTGLIDGKRSRLTKGGCFLIPPATMLETENAGAEELGLYRLTFRMKRVEVSECESAQELAPPELFPLAGKLNIQPFGQWSTMLGELHKYESQGEGLESFKQHIRLQELLYYLCERNLIQAESDPRSAVSQTIDEMHADLSKTVNIKNLAERAKIGTRQYTYLFKELTGQSPLDYVTQLRINQAKKQLLVSNDHLNTIARNAGFQDVYYFSRRFKQVVGLSPKHFVSKRRRELRVVALYYSGILTAMGVKPVGANLTWWGGSTFLKEIEADIVDVGATPSLGMIAGLEPDLILMNSNNLAEYDQLSKIAPSVLIPYDGNRSIYEDTRLVGELINNPRAAEQFIVRYEKKAALSRAKIASAGIANESKTAAIIRIEGNGSMFSVFGDNYGRSGWAIYRGFQFKAPRKVQQIIESGAQVEQRLPIRLLPEYAAAADFLFVINEGEGVELVSRSVEWNQLPAVVHDRIFELNKEMFSYADPVSIEAQLELLTDLLLERRT
ncbi:helix-turn-helix domain-containing protein [Paenibacillus eucommiae]|uniref:Iron complex transport system substrate-binding protein n=1 Tax=Paenibacillus eucommiae TaxID=1355755 RepID=A0ABS4J7D8_9BACL|nr:helix-turn-helix domain-containing protein [Paenibacillus eucommiae]MBP1995753.1 iron complex transport system substrate-binding protein [Paenibacillus eucommiae]